MDFRVGDRVKTTSTTMGVKHTQYHNVTGTVTGIRDSFTVPILFKPDVDVHGEGVEWALFESELVHLPGPDYWREKYLALKAKVDSFRYGTEGM